MRDARTWYDGTSNPLDSPGNDPRVGMLGRRPDPRSLEQGVAQQQTTECMAQSQSQDPLDILLGCEAADEAEGCGCGAHLDEYHQSRRDTKSK